MCVFPAKETRCSRGSFSRVRGAFLRILQSLFPSFATMGDDYKKDPMKEEEITITDAVPAGPAPVQDGPPVPPGHARFYCEKCRTVRLLSQLPQNEGMKHFYSLLFLTFCFFRIFFSLMICHKMRRHGDALDALLSTQLLLPNAQCALSCSLVFLGDYGARNFVL